MKSAITGNYNGIPLEQRKFVNFATKVVAFTRAPFSDAQLQEGSAVPFG